MTLAEWSASALDKELQEKCDAAQVPGMALVVHHHGVPIFESYYGYRDVGRQLPVTPTTIFGAASVTKSFTALAIMQLEDAEKLSVYDPVVKWLPEWRMPHAVGDKQATIHHLLTHTSGLPGMDAVNRARAKSIREDPDGPYMSRRLGLKAKGDPIKEVTELMEVMSNTDYTLLGPPGARFNYSNEGYALLQAIIERASGQAFINYMEQNIFDPLNMQRSTFTMTDWQHDDNIAELYAYTEDNKAIFHSPQWWDVGHIYSNGSLKTCAADLMKYLDVYRLDGVVNGHRLLSEASLQKMAFPHVTMPTGEQYGYGLLIDTPSGVKRFGHGGSIKGVSSHMKIAKAHGITVGVLANLAEVDVKDLVGTVLKHVCGITDEDECRVTDHQTPTDRLDTFVGKYQSAEGQKITITIRDEGLQLHTHYRHTPLKRTADNRFVTSNGQQIVFLTNDWDEVTGIFRGVRFIPKTSE